MKKVFDINTVMEMFVEQTREEGMTPLCTTRNGLKLRRFYFKGDTAYSYGAHFPLARMEGNTMYVKATTPSNTTRKHRTLLMSHARLSRKEIINSDDLKTPKVLDETMKNCLQKFLNARKRSRSYANYIITVSLRQKQFITESKFPLIFEEKYEKLRTMMLSKDKEVIDLAKKIIKEQKLI